MYSKRCFERNTFVFQTSATETETNHGRFGGRRLGNESVPFETSPSAGQDSEDYVLIDVPPYSEKLVQQLRKMMGPHGRVTAILITCRDCIHYDDAPGVLAFEERTW